MLRRFRPRPSAAALAVTLLIAAAGPVAGQSGTVEEVVVQGLRRMTQEAFLHAFGVRAGEPYDRGQVLSGYRRLWALGLFETITVEAEDGPGGGKVLIVKVEERPVLSSIEYEENKVLTRTQIEDRLKERKVALEPGKPLSLKAVFGAEAVIRDYLAEKGYLGAQVGHTVTEITTASRGVTFSIRPGGKTRIGEIAFVGNEVFTDRRLLRELKLNEPRRWWWPWSNKSLYHPLKWDQDAAKIRELYQNAGYLDVEVRAPVVETEKEIVKGGPGAAGEGALLPTAAAEGSVPPAQEDVLAVESGRTGPAGEDDKSRRKAERARKKEERARRKAQPKVKRLVALTVSVVEGPQYRMGEIRTTGNTVLTEEQVLSSIPLKRGDVLRDGDLKAAVEKITRLYNDRGYLYATGVRQIKRHEGEPVADVTVSLTEDKPYYVGRIEFSGNTSTQDRVLRRELVLREGDLFSKTRLDLSKYKINQLGYFEVKDEPSIEPIEGESRVAVTIAGEEKGRNEIQIGGGYSGLDGAFFTGYYSTRNFLGRGQILQTSIQVGGRANRYSVSFIEPWFLNRPYTLGFSLFKRDVDYGGNLRSSSSGGGVVLGRQLGRYTRAQLNYNYEKARSTVTSFQNITLPAPVYAFPQPSWFWDTRSGLSEGTNRISSITPSYEYNTIDNPYRPRAGWNLNLYGQVAGGFLGGDTTFLKPVVNYTSYRKAFGRSLVALHSEAGLVRSWGDGSTSPTTVFGVPRFQRFWIGGDTQGPRVFDIRTITPRRFLGMDSAGNVVATLDPRGFPVSLFDRNGDNNLDERDLVELGGDRFYLIQGEYVFPFKGPAEVALFLDAGSTLFEDTSWGFSDARVSAGVEVRFFLPVFPVPLRLIYGFPLRDQPLDRTSSFTFSIGKSF